VIFVNNSVSQTIAIIPNVANIATVQGVYASQPQANAVAVINGAGSVTMQPGDKLILDTLFASCQWNGVASATGAFLTVLEF
jgi:aspartate 1-decarboxylase